MSSDGLVEPSRGRPWLAMTELPLLMGHGGLVGDALLLLGTLGLAGAVSQQAVGLAVLLRVQSRLHAARPLGASALCSQFGIVIPGGIDHRRRPYLPSLLHKVASHTAPYKGM